MRGVKLIRVLMAVAWVSFVWAIVLRIGVLPQWFGLLPITFIKFAVMCLLFAIAMAQLQLVEKR